MRNKLTLLLLILIIIIIYFQFAIIQKETSELPPIEPFSSYKDFIVTLYYPDISMTKLVPEIRKISNDNAKIEEIIIKELLKGTKNEKLINVIPNKTKLISITTVGDVIFINFSKNIINEDVTEKEEALMLYSIVNTITQLKNITQVQILIEGEIKEIFQNHFKISESLEYRSIFMNDYNSPINLVHEYYNNIIYSNYKKLTELFVDVEEVEIKYLLKEFRGDSKNIIYYNITDYIIDIADNEKINVRVNIKEMYKNEQKDRDEVFYIVIKDNKSKIMKIESLH